MKVLVDRSFEKDVKKLNDRKMKQRIAACVEQLLLAEDFSQVTNLKSLKGEKNCYRIRIGEYRLGLVFEQDTVTMVRCLHRREIYRHFPK